MENPCPVNTSEPMYPQRIKQKQSRLEGLYASCGRKAIRGMCKVYWKEDPAPGKNKQTNKQTNKLHEDGQRSRHQTWLSGKKKKKKPVQVVKQKENAMTAQLDTKMSGLGAEKTVCYK